MRSPTTSSMTPRIKGVCLTGSVAAGRSIAARAGKNLKVSSMELGGSDAFIVLEDADLDLTIPWAVWGRMYNTGQTCCAAKRFIVVESVADAFIARFTAALAALKAGDPMDEKTTLGPCRAKRRWCNCWRRSTTRWPMVRNCCSVASASIVRARIWSRRS